ncbi:MAG TPA: hypothetical protein VIH87_02765 [Methylocella sp.]
MVYGLLALVSAMQIAFLIKADKTARITADAAKQSADAATQAANATLGLERPFFHILNVELIGEGATMYLT